MLAGDTQLADAAPVGGERGEGVWQSGLVFLIFPPMVDFPWKQSRVNTRHSVINSQQVQPGTVLTHLHFVLARERLI